MAKLEALLEKPWNLLVGAVTIGFAVLMGFERDLAEVSLELRFIIVGMICVGAMFFVAEVLALKRKGSTGYVAEAARGPSSLDIIWRGTSLLIVGVLATFLLLKIVTFHNVRILRRVDRLDSSVGTIEIQPSHRSTELTLTLSTPQDGPKIVDKSFGNWNKENPVSWGMKDESPSGVTLTISDFVSPKLFGVWYRLSGDASHLDVEGESVPEGMRILRHREVQTFRTRIFVFGGGLCAVGLLYWCYRSRWLRRES
jgi:hypothetical protein